MCLGAPEFWDGDVSHIQRHTYCSIAGPTPRSFLSLQLSEPERSVCVCNGGFQGLGEECLMRLDRHKFCIKRKLTHTHGGGEADPR